MLFVPSTLASSFYNTINKLLSILFGIFSIPWLTWFIKNTIIEIEQKIREYFINELLLVS